jgi:RHS repeat-associated protein
MKTLVSRSAVLALLVIVAGGARAHTLPDLTVTALSGAPASIAAGQSFSLTSTVKATGAAVTRSFVVSFYLSTDATITTADTVIGSRTVSSLALNATSTATTTVTVPAGQAARSYYVGAIVDSANVVSESSETNNTRAGTQMQVTGAGIDLTVTSLSGAPASIGAGASFNLTSTVAASGNGSAGAFTVSFYLSTDATITSADTLIGSRTVSSLAAGASSTATTSVTVPASLAVGTYTVGAIVDSGSAVAETSETNNARAGSQVTVVKPDLSMAGLSGVPSTIGRGDTITVTDTVALASGGGAVSTFSVGYYLATTSPVTTSGLFLGSRTVSGLSAGQSSTASTALVIPTSLATGTWYLGAIADMSGVIAESNESNNAATSAAMVVGAFSCQRAASPIDDGNPCTTDACDPVRGVTHDPVVPGTGCSDGNYCNGFETCDGAGTCLSGLAPQIDDGNPCTADSCDPATGVWHTPLAVGTSCSDGNVCNGVEACNGAGTCQAGTPPGTDDHDPCTADSCDPVLGVRHTRIASCTVVPPDPATLAPANDPTVATDIAASTAFLYSGTNPIQYAVAPGTIEARRVVVLRGSVKDRDGAPLPGARVTVLNHPEFGWTASRADGAFDIAVNGGGIVTLNYQKDGFLVSQRQVATPWRDFVSVPDVVLVPFDTRITPVAMGAGAAQVARGTTTSDGAGARQATLVFPPGTQATMRLADGSVQGLPGTINVRATEYTVGAAGPKSMPGELPPTSGYTYAVELSVDEAVMAGATDVQFNQPVAFYVENFLGFPVGGIVPVGYYDRANGAWVPSDNGRIVSILGMTNGLADIDADGDGLADDAPKLLALGVTDAERAQLASTYSQGASLWRAPVTHFTPYDCNWAYGCESDSCPAPDMPPPDSDRPVDKPNCQSGSIIECESQGLGEQVPIGGTPFSLSYSSLRQPGKHPVLTVQVTGANPPPSAIGVYVEIELAGRKITYTVEKRPFQTVSYEWDGLDSYGRAVQGPTKAIVRVAYEYRSVYLEPSARVSRGFASPSYSGRRMTMGSAIGTVPIPPARFWSVYETWLGRTDQRSLAAGLGGWSITPYHQYMPDGRLLLSGNGSQRGASGSGALVVNDLLHFAEAGLSNVTHWAMGPDGSAYFAVPPSQWNQARIVRFDPSGSLITIAGNGPACTYQAVCAPSGDGGAATDACLCGPHGVSVGPNGSIAFVDSERVRVIAPGGSIRTIAGTGTPGYSGEGGPAVAAQVRYVGSTAWLPDGTFVGLEPNRIFQIAPDGTLNRVAGQGAAEGWECLGQPMGDDGAASAATVCSIDDSLAAGPDGSIYLASLNNTVRRISPDGVIRRVAGGGPWGTLGDGLPATSVYLESPEGLAVARDGTLFIGEMYRLRHVMADGRITTIAGSGCNELSSNCPGRSGSPATLVPVRWPRPAVDPVGTVFFVEDPYGYSGLRSLTLSLPGASLDDIQLASADGGSLYYFDYRGRQRREVSTATGAVIYEYEHGTDGRLAAIVDAFGNRTTIERLANGAPAAIVAPTGQRTPLTVDGNGFLSSITNPAGESVSVVSDAGGLLREFIDARRYSHRFDFDAAGRLIRDENPSGSTKTLSRLLRTIDSTDEVSVTTRAGRTTRYQVQLTTDGRGLRRTIGPDGTAFSSATESSGRRTSTLADGTTMTFEPSPDPRWGMEAPTGTSVVTTPGGRSMTAAVGRTTDPYYLTNPFSAAALEESVTINGRTFASRFDIGTRRWTTTTPMGRSAVTTLGPQGQATRVEAPGVPPADITYDLRGRLEWISQGSRTLHVEYDAAGYPWRITDPQGRQVTFEYDLAGRVWRQTLPGSRQVVFGPDPNGNLSSLTPPGRPAHGLTYWPGDALKSYDPPAASVGGPLWPTGYSYDLDGALAGVALPDGTSVVPTYEPSTGRLSSVTTAHGMTGVGYDPQGRLWTLSTADGALTYGYDGFLVTSETSTGAVPGSVTWTYDNDFRPATQIVNGSAVTYGYDLDGILTAAGALTLTPEPATGRLASTALGSVTTSQTYTAYGEPWTTTARVGGSAVYAYTLNRSELSSRIEGKTETIGGATTSWVYGYDPAGRLATVTRDGTVVASYGYDENGNRTSRTTVGGTEIGTPDEQDRLRSHGNTTYTYRPTGALESKTEGGATSWYDYDALGNLRAVLLPGGGRIDYVIDGMNRRLGKKVNGALVEGFLYEGKLRPVARLDGAGQVKARFVYGTRINVPEYMVTPAGTYRILTDHLGSPRLVVDLATGAIAQRVDYDEWGVVLADSNPGFQPFGFAGGIYDRDTGLVRFGARDYDPAVGRWTNKDRARFRGGLNFYEYAGSDPVNFADFTGKYAVGVPTITPIPFSTVIWISVYWAGGAALAGAGGWLAGTWLNHHVSDYVQVALDYHFGPADNRYWPVPTAVKPDIRQVNDIARRYHLDEEQRDDFGRFLEDEKACGRGGTKNKLGDFTWNELDKKIREFLGLE